MTGLLRERLGFDGVTISDALDMRAIAQGEAQAAAILAALRAGVDLLLCGPDRDAQRRIEAALLAGAADGRIDPVADAAARRRIDALRRRLGEAGPPPDLGIVGGPAHAALARELAERSLTLVRDDARRLPLALPADATILAVMPTPIDLTPADTSSTVAPGLAAALRTRFARVDEVVTSAAPTDAEIAAVRDRVGRADAVVVGTIDGAREPSQLALLEAVAAVAGDRPVVGGRAADALGRRVVPGRRRRGLHLLDPHGVDGRARGRAVRRRSRSPAGCRSGSTASPRSPAREPPRRDPRAARGRVAVPRDAARRHRVAGRGASATAATRSSTSSSPPAARRTTPRSTPSTCSGSATG